MAQAATIFLLMILALPLGWLAGRMDGNDRLSSRLFGGFLLLVGLVVVLAVVNGELLRTAPGIDDSDMMEPSRIP